MADNSGEIHNLITEQQFTAGVYRVEFDTKSYWKSIGSTPFHEVADVSMNKQKGGSQRFLALSCYLILCRSQRVASKDSAAVSQQQYLH